MESVYTELKLNALPLPIRPFKSLLEPIQCGSLDLELGGRVWHIEGEQPGPAGHIQLRRPLTLMQRIASAGDIGFAEGFLDGDWSSEDLPALLWLIASNETVMRRAGRGNRWVRWLAGLKHRLNANTKRGSRRNIAAHYDLGNDFYRLWLDPSMTYSSAWFGDGAKDLAGAQAAKYRRILAMSGAQSDHHILEIGCGWGGFAQIAAEAGHRVTGLTLSRQQLAWGRDVNAQAIANGQVELRLQDYRDVEGQFDHIVSIEMFEAVGEAYWPVYLQRIRELLKPGGRAVLQIILIADRDFERYRQRPDFIQRYIFPGGMLPSQSVLTDQIEQAGLRIAELELDASGYAHTLAAWHQEVSRRADQIRALGHDERFLRLWRYYLAYCEAGFRTKRIDLARLVVTH